MPRVELNLGETAVINLGPVPSNADEDDLVPAPSKTDRSAASGAPGQKQTVTLFLVTPTAATPEPGAGVEGK